MIRCALRSHARRAPQVAIFVSGVGEVDIFVTVALGGRVGLARGAPVTAAESSG